jgi:phosphatidylinositol 3,5-bisphosphate 5-phosphatase
VTKRKRIAKILRHSIYMVKDMKLIPMFKTTSNHNNADECRYINYFQQVQIDQGFYFSYTYDLTRSLQENVMRKIRKREQANKEFEYSHVLDGFHKETDYADIYAHDFFEGRDSGCIQEHKPWENQMMWNYFLVRDLYECLKRKKWVLPVVHGSIDFKNIVDSGNKFTLILIARRSRHYAGTRYLRRGINQEGRPANFVEIEQIVFRD